MQYPLVRSGIYSSLDCGKHTGNLTKSYHIHVKISTIAVCISDVYMTSK